MSSVSKEQAKEAYEGKFFYVVVRSAVSGQLTLSGPDENIRYITPIEENPYHPTYRFARVIDGKIEQAFEEHQVVVTNKQL